MIIEEHFSKTYNDISSIFAWLVEPELVQTAFHEYMKKTDYFSCFSNHYPTGKEREFIKELEEQNPGKYSKYVITWCDSN